MQHVSFVINNTKKILIYFYYIQKIKYKLILILEIIINDAASSQVRMSKKERKTKTYYE